MKSVRWLFLKNKLVSISEVIFESINKSSKKDLAVYLFDSNEIIRHLATNRLKHLSLSKLD